jgi:hypothetical protein
MKTCKICSKKLPKKCTVYCSRECYGISQSKEKYAEYQYEKELRRRIAAMPPAERIGFEKTPVGLSERQAQELFIMTHNRKNRHVRLR